MAQTVLNELQSGGYTSVRYEALAPFLSTNSAELINFTVLDYLVNTAATLGITVIIDPVHNYPESTSYTLQSHFAQWENQLVTVGERYNNAQNVILECVNEYTLSDAPQKYQTIVNTLRSDGITLPLQFTYMWGNVAALIPPKDPLNKISIGHHVYANHDSDTSYMFSNETFIQYCTRVGIEAREKDMFANPTNACWFGYALAHGTKVLCTEIGGSYVNDPVMNPYNVAFVIRTLQYAKMYGVGVDCFRVGQNSNIQTYETLAEQYFHISFFTT
jgi:aryl-phospho-beta-D-glucosidase BglC (GH1 family)